MASVTFSSQPVRGGSRTTVSKRREANSSAMSSACAVRGSTLSMPLRARFCFMYFAAGSQLSTAVTRLARAARKAVRLPTPE